MPRVQVRRVCEPDRDRLPPSQLACRIVLSASLDPITTSAGRSRQRLPARAADASAGLAVAIGLVAFGLVRAAHECCPKPATSLLPWCSAPRIARRVCEAPVRQ